MGGSCEVGGRKGERSGERGKLKAEMPREGGEGVLTPGVQSPNPASAISSHSKRLSSRFAKVNSRTNPSAYYLC